MGKHKFNHDAENLEEAVNLSIDELGERLNNALEGTKSSSESVEAISKEFNKVELAFLLELAVLMGNELQQKLEIVTLGSLLGGLGK